MKIFNSTKEVLDYMSKVKGNNYMNDKLPMNNFDVVSYYKDIIKGYAYLYEKDEFIDFLKELFVEADEENKESFMNDIEDYQSYNFDFVIDSNGNYTIF